MARLEGRPVDTASIPVHPALTGLLTPRVGGVYGVDAASLAVFRVGFGANDSGGSASSIGSSSLTLSTTRALVRSSSSLSLTNGDRFGARISRTSGTVITGPAFVLIRFLGN